MPDDIERPRVSALSDRLQRAARDVADRYHRLALVVEHGSASGTLDGMVRGSGWAVVNVGLALSERLLELSMRQRALKASGVLEDLISAGSPDVVALTDIEVLFAAELALDPLRLLQNLSRHRTVIAVWPGYVDGDAIAYAEPGHPEHRRYCAPDAVVIQDASVIPE
jgi:hypothetical protein